MNYQQSTRCFQMEKDLKVETIIEQAKAIFIQQSKIKGVKLFGSFSKGTQSDSSDLDFLIETVPNSGFHMGHIVELQIKLEELFQRPVDIVDIKSISTPHLIESIINATTNITIL